MYTFVLTISLIISSPFGGGIQISTTSFPVKDLKTCQNIETILKEKYTWKVDGFLNSASQYAKTTCVKTQ